MRRLVDMPVHRSRTPHKELCGNSEQAAACIRLWSIRQKYCQVLKVGQVRPSQQHIQTSKSDLSAWQTGANTVACLCCLQFWICLYVSYFGFFYIIVQGADMASDLDRGTCMQNCDPKKAISFRFCVARFSPLVFFSKLSASGQIHFPPCCSTLMAFLCPIDPENKTSLLISSGEFI